MRVKPIAEAKAAKKADIAARKAAKEERKQAKLAKMALEAGEIVGAPVDAEGASTADQVNTELDVASLVQPPIVAT